MSVPAPFVPGYYAYYDNYVKTSQVLFPSSLVPPLLPPPRPTSTPASLGDSKSVDLDCTRTLKREARIKDEDECELTHKDVASKVKEALSIWIHACQATNTTNCSTGESKPVTIKKDSKTPLDTINKQTNYQPSNHYQEGVIP